MAWGLSVGFLFLVLPLKQALFTEDMFIREQQMQMEERTNQGTNCFEAILEYFDETFQPGIGSALGLGGQNMGLDLSQLEME